MDLEQFWYYTDWHAFVNDRAYEAPVPPRKLLDVSPTDVTYCTGALPLNWGLGRVRGGDWDDQEECDRIRETTLYTGLRQRFEEGREWPETDLCERTASRFEDRDVVRGYESIDEFVETRCAYIDDLYESIERDGYRPNTERGHEPASEDNEWETAYANHLEPLVVVARDGEIFWTEGYHRFTIADLLGVETVPVFVLCRHAEWQERRDRVATTTRGERAALPVDLDHPDLQDL